MISKADLKKDKKDIIELWERNFPGIPKARYEWLYEGNPAGPAICWIAKKDGEATGSAALFPRRLFVNGQAITGGIAGDFSVIKGFRGFGPALSLQREAVSNYVREGFDILFGFPNKYSEGILIRAGYTAVGDILSLTRPLKSQYYLKKNFNLPIIAKIVSKPIDMVMRMLARENFYTKPKDYACEPLTHFDSRFDILWEKVAPQFTIIGERSCSYLNWRFSRSPHREYSIFVIKHAKTHEIFGYIIFYFVQNKAKIADLLSLNDYTLNALLSEFLLLLRRKCIDSVSINLAGCKNLVGKLQKYGFYIRDNSGKFILRYPPGSSFSEDIKEINNWYFMAGDNDI